MHFYKVKRSKKSYVSPLIFSSFYRPFNTCKQENRYRGCGRGNMGGGGLGHGGSFGLAWVKFHYKHCGGNILVRVGTCWDLLGKPHNAFSYLV